MSQPTEGRLRLYRPSERAAELLREALQVNTKDEASLLDFANSWGLLGVGLGTVEETADLLRRPQAQPLFDSVWATRRAIEALQASFRWWRALQARRWSSPAIPSLGSAWPSATTPQSRAESTIAQRRALARVARAVIPPPDYGRLELEADPSDDRSHLVDRVVLGGHEDPYLCGAIQGAYLADLARHPSKGGVRGEAERPWRAFAAAVTPHLRSVHPTIEWRAIDRRPVPAFRARRLIDFLWVTLWDWVTQGARLRRCPNCQGWFPATRRGKIYCSPMCANQASSKAAYKRKVRKVRRLRPTRRRHTGGS